MSLKVTEQKAIDLVNDLAEFKDWEKFLDLVSYYSAYYGRYSPKPRRAFLATLREELRSRSFEVSLMI